MTYGIFTEDMIRLGTVASFAGNKPAERWVAWSCFRPQGQTQKAFRLKRLAVAWLREQYEQAEK